MYVYFLRHANAVPRGTAVYPNDDRPLTVEGIQEMENIAEALRTCIFKVGVILTSPLSRALQTAKIVGNVFEPHSKIESTDILAPGKSPDMILPSLGRYAEYESIMLVGHEPDLGYLASKLLGAGGSIIKFKKGGMCCIEVTSLPPKAPGILHWHTTPEQLRMMAGGSSHSSR